MYLDNSEIIKIHFDVVWTVFAGVCHLECQLVTVTFLELAPSGFVYQFGERNAALHPLAYFGFSGEVAHRTIVRVVVSLIPFEVDAEYRTFAIFHCHEAFELQSQFGSRCIGRQEGCVNAPYGMPTRD